MWEEGGKEGMKKGRKKKIAPIVFVMSSDLFLL